VIAMSATTATNPYEEYHRGRKVAAIVKLLLDIRQLEPTEAIRQIVMDDPEQREWITRAAGVKPASRETWAQVVRALGAIEADRVRHPDPFEGLPQ
jgi:hypothetical protein